MEYVKLSRSLIWYRRRGFHKKFGLHLLYVRMIGLFFHDITIESYFIRILKYCSLFQPFVCIDLEVELHNLMVDVVKERESSFYIKDAIRIGPWDRWFSAPLSTVDTFSSTWPISLPMACNGTVPIKGLLLKWYLVVIRSI